MRKIMYALATITLLAEPAVAMPVNPAPSAPVISDGQIVNVAQAARGTSNRAPCGSSSLGDAVLVIFRGKEVLLRAVVSGTFFILLVSLLTVSQRRSATLQH